MKVQYLDQGLASKNNKSKWGQIFKIKVCDISYDHLKGQESNCQNNS